MIKHMKKFISNLALFCTLLILFSCNGNKEPQTFVNPVIYSDVPDIDAIRVGDDYFMISTTMHMMPGAPIMHSKDLVNWDLVTDIYDFRHKPIAGFQYTDFFFEGEDLFLLCRVALNEAPNGHDTNFQIFDRIHNFRYIKMEKSI